MVGRVYAPQQTKYTMPGQQSFVPIPGASAPAAPAPSAPAPSSSSSPRAPKAPTKAPKSFYTSDTKPVPGFNAPAVDGGSGGGAVVAPSMPPSMEALANGSGDGGDAGSEVIDAPSRFRQGIGTRMMPLDSQSLAALRKIY